MNLKNVFFAIGIAASVLAHAGVEEGLAAYKTKDFKTALAEWLPLAKQGNADAQRYMGVLYASGQGVTQDFKQAIDWTRKAAEKGQADAQTNLGIAYINGKGVAQDYQMAASWFRKAAAQGNAAAQGSLGVMYARGLGVPRLRVAAGALYIHSATSDLTGSRNASRNGLDLKLTAADQAAIEILNGEMAKPNNLLNALDNYVKNPTEVIQ